MPNKKTIVVVHIAANARKYSLQDGTHSRLRRYG